VFMVMGKKAQSLLSLPLPLPSRFLSHLPWRRGRSASGGELSKVGRQRRAARRPPKCGVRGQPRRGHGAAHAPRGCRGGPHKKYSDVRGGGGDWKGGGERGRRGGGEAETGEVGSVGFWFWFCPFSSSSRHSLPPLSHTNVRRRQGRLVRAPGRGRLPPAQARGAALARHAAVFVAVGVDDFGGLGESVCVKVGRGRVRGGANEGSSYVPDRSELAPTNAPLIASLRLVRHRQAGG